MTSVPLRCRIKNTSPACALGLEILLDDTSIYRNEHVKEPVDFSYDLVEDDAVHEIKFVLFGKTADHTMVDDQGNIISDAMLNISDFTVDDIDIQQIIYDKSVYTHDFNGSRPATQDKFYGDAGCNGTISIEISTPVYIWLLENL